MAAFSITGSNKILGGNDVFVIAEIGKNFIQTEAERPVEEYIENAKALIDAAVESGADAVKFQTHNVEDEQLNLEIVSPHFKAKDRYSWVTRNDKSTPVSFWKILKAHANERDIIFFSTPMSRGAAQKLDQVGVPLWKVGSGDVQDNVCLDYIAAQQKPIIISTGMVSLAELDMVVNFITKRNKQLVVLYCISKYPCPPEEFNLSTLELFHEKYPELVIGFSDHSIGYEVDLAAVKLGAQVIEKHFSFDRTLWGADHKVSMTPQEMKEMVIAIRGREWENVDAQKFYGEKTKELEGAHNQFRPIFNKALVAGQDIPVGTVLSKEMIYAMRPQQFCDGLNSERYEEVLGKSTRRDLKKYDPLNEETIVLAA